MAYSMQILKTTVIIETFEPVLLLSIFLIPHLLIIIILLVFIVVLRIPFLKPPNLILCAHVPPRPLGGSGHIVHKPQHARIPYRQRELIEPRKRKEEFCVVFLLLVCIISVRVPRCCDVAVGGGRGLLLVLGG